MMNKQSPGLSKDGVEYGDPADYYGDREENNFSKQVGLSN